MFLGGIENHENKIRGLRSRNNLSSSALSFGSTFNDTWKIENLNLSSSIL